MSRSRKRKLMRLERKYKSFNLRTVFAFLFVAFIMFVGSLSFNSESRANNYGKVNTLQNLAVIWTGMIFLIVSGQFGLGILRAQAEKRFPALAWQALLFLAFLTCGLIVAYYGAKDYLPYQFGR